MLSNNNTFCPACQEQLHVNKTLKVNKSFRHPSSKKKLITTASTCLILLLPLFKIQL